MRAVSSLSLDDTYLPDRAWKVFDIINAKIEHGDVKAGAVLGASGVAAAALIGLITSRSDRDTLLTIAAAASGVFVLMAATFSCGALWPRRLRNRSPDSPLYFDHIVRRSSGSRSAYEDELRVLLADSEALTCEIIRQIWATAHVATRKYNFLDRAMICLFGSLVTLGGTAVIFAIHYRGP